MDIRSQYYRSKMGKKRLIVDLLDVDHGELVKKAHEADGFQLRAEIRARCPWNSKERSARPWRGKHGAKVGHKAIRRGGSMDAERVADIGLRTATLEREGKELEAAPWEIMLAQGRLANALEQIALNGRER